MPQPILDRPIRIALVGCGRIAECHLEAFGNHSDQLELVALCDNDSSALDHARQGTGVKAFANLHHLLEGVEADLISICTPSGLHPEHAVAAAEAGFHVVTEKPMATRWADGQRMVRACDEAGRYLFVVKQNRFNRTLQLLRRAVDLNRFGRIHMVNVNVFWTRPQAYYDSARWRGTWEYDGGALMNQASHYVDLLDWLIGPVESVQAYTATLQRRIQVEDTAVMNVRWRSGALGSLNVTMLTHPRNLEGSITILGENGSVKVGGVAVNEIQHWEFAARLPEDEEVFGSSYTTESVYGFGHTAFYGNVIETLRGNAEPDTDGREGLKSLEVLIATYLSARDGKRVSLPLEY
jgi:UDP-N-acetyl-2-amino-2-deoxyglucuronate dehydrogenase